MLSWNIVLQLVSRLLKNRTRKSMILTDLNLKTEHFLKLRVSSKGSERTELLLSASEKNITYNHEKDPSYRPLLQV